MPLMTAFKAGSTSRCTEKKVTTLSSHRLPRNDSQVTCLPLPGAPGLQWSLQWSVQPTKMYTKKARQANEGRCLGIAGGW